jgi:hypothetical protein
MAKGEAPQRVEGRVRFVSILGSPPMSSPVLATGLGETERPLRLANQSDTDAAVKTSGEDEKGTVAASMPSGAIPPSASD